MQQPRLLGSEKPDREALGVVTCTSRPRQSVRQTSMNVFGFLYFVVKWSPNLRVESFCGQKKEKEKKSDFYFFILPHALKLRLFFGLSHDFKGDRVFGSFFIPVVQHDCSSQ